MSRHFRITTLIAGILMAIQPVCIVAFGIRDLPRYSPLIPSYQWIYMKNTIMDLLTLISLPALFLLLFLAAISLHFSKTQRYVASALALIQATVVAFFGWIGWNRDIRLDWHDSIALARPTVRIFGPMEWFNVREIWTAFLDARTFLWLLGLLIFLVGLAAQPGSAPPDIRASGFQAKLLRSAQFAALFAIAVALWFRFYPALPLFTRIRFDMSPFGLGSAIPQLVTPSILLVSLLRYQTAAKQLPQPDSTASAHCDAAASSPEA